MSKRAELNEAMKTAMKAKDEVTLSTVRLINAKIKDKDIEARSADSREGIDDGAILSLLQGMIKQRQESAEIYQKNGRAELAERENAEINIIRGFMPKQMDESEVAKAVEELIAELAVSDIKGMGKVMAELKARYAGQMDMARAGDVVRKKLAA